MPRSKQPWNCKLGKDEKRHERIKLHRMLILCPFQVQYPQARLWDWSWSETLSSKTQKHYTWVTPGLIVRKTMFNTGSKLRKGIGALFLSQSYKVQSQNFRAKKFTLRGIDSKPALNTLFFHKNIVAYSYLSADLELKIFLWIFIIYYTNITTYLFSNIFGVWMEFKHFEASPLA